MKNGKVIIDTQQHFNDLIIRFRAIVLAAFVSFAGTIILLQRINSSITLNDIYLLLAIAIIFWITAFCVDYLYYNRLLFGSVSQALKYDNSEVLSKLGLFGLTQNISNHIHPPTSKILVCLYYFIPMLCIFIVLLIKFIGVK